MVDIPVASGYEHSIVLFSNVSSPNVNSAHITGAYMEADHCRICVGLADGLHVMSFWTIVPLPPHTPNEVISELEL